MTVNSFISPRGSGSKTDVSREEELGEKESSRIHARTKTHQKLKETRVCCLGLKKSQKRLALGRSKGSRKKEGGQWGKSDPWSRDFGTSKWNYRKEKTMIRPEEREERCDKATRCSSKTLESKPQTDRQVCERSSRKKTTSTIARKR